MKKSPACCREQSCDNMKYSYDLKQKSSAMGGTQDFFFLHALFFTVHISPIAATVGCRECAITEMSVIQ